MRRKPFALLSHLVRHPQRLVTHAELLEAGWGKSIATSDSLLRTHVYEVRRALGEGIVETVVGRGYRFVAKVEHAATSETFIGHDAELETLATLAFRTTRDRRRRIVFVTGEAGIGKTTLLDAFLERAQTAGDPWIARGTSIIDAVNELCRGPRRHRVLDALSRRAPQTLRDLALALETMSEQAPVILALDDLQSADALTADAIAMLAQRLEPAPILVLGAYRPAELARAQPLARVVAEHLAHARAIELPVDPFDARTLERYLAVRYPLNRFSHAFVSTIHEATGGNPRFVARLVGELENRGTIRQLDGVWGVAT